MDMYSFIIFISTWWFGSSQIFQDNVNLFENVCPKAWFDNKDSCYKFTRSPQRNREGARQNCEVSNQGFPLGGGGGSAPPT